MFSINSWTVLQKFTQTLLLWYTSSVVLHLKKEAKAVATLPQLAVKWI